MSEKALKFNNIILNKKKFHNSKEPIDLLPVDLDQIVLSYKFKHNDEGFKYFISYLEGEIVKPLFIILPQFFFLSGFSFTDNDNSQDSRGMEGTIVFHSTTSTCSQTFRHLFATLHVR